MAVPRTALPWKELVVATKPEPDSISSIVFAPFARAWRMAMGLAFLWVVSCVVHIGFVHFYDLDPAPHMEDLIGYYVDHAGEQGKLTPWVSQVAESGYWLVFQATATQRRLFSGTPTAREQPSTHTMKLGANTRKSLLVAFKTEVTVIAYATLLFGVKLAIALLWLMLMGLLLVVSTIDGLVQRAIRRACGGHESASIYHRAKHFGLGLLPSAIGVIYFCWPTAIERGWIFVPGTLVAVLLARLQVTYYKKYL